MIRRKGPILAAAVIAAFALGWYRGLFGIDQVAPTAAPPTAPTGAGTATRGDAPAVPADGRPASEQGASAPAGAPLTAPAATPAAPVGRNADASPDAAASPGFDVVRVEPDGSTVVAGKGVANEAITLTDGTRTLGEARTDANGDFVMTLSLPTGSHRLQLAQRDDVVSDDAAVVNVPPPGKPDQLLVMMQRPGEASEIIQRPEEASAASASAETTPPAAVEAERSRDEGEALVATAPPPAVASDAAQDARSAEPDLSVEAVEIEGDRLFVAGSAKGSATVRVYLDDRPVAEARSGAGDRFIASARADVAVGDHTIRADALDAGGRVVGRVEVPFQRPEGNTMAAVAAAPGTGQDIGPAAPTGQAGSTAPSLGEGTSRSSAAAGAAAPGAAPAPDIATATGASVPVPPAAAGEPQAVRQAPLQASASRVIIRRGDTLWRISRETYGRGSRYTVIYLANGDQIRDPNRIYPGQVFRMPDGEGAEAPPRG